MYTCIFIASLEFLTITITNYLFRQNQTRNITKVILITHTKIPTLVDYKVRAKEIALEDIMAANIQPPVIF